jgi:hypothetical protein
MATVSLKLEGFKEAIARIGPRVFRRRLKKNLRVASKRVGLMAEREIKEGINSGRLKANAPLTEAIKGSSRPLVNTGQLVRSVTSKVGSFDEVFVGVLRSRAIRDPNTGKVRDVKEIAAILHQGAVIRVTEQMRRFFFAMADQFPERWKPLSSSTKVIVIPPRPFLKFATTPKAIRRYKQEWEQAVEKTLRGVE